MTTLDLVYEAISKGHSLVGDIMADTGYDEDTVRTAITRLRDAERIGREPCPNTRHHTRYFIVSRSRCLLAEHWRGVAAEA